MDEVAAIEAYQRGESHAFGVLFELHATYVYRTSYLIIRDATRAEDVVQDTFLILAQRLPSLSPGPLRSWLGRVAANLSLNERRRAWDVSWDTVAPAERNRLEGRANAPGPEASLERDEMGAGLRAAVAALAPRQRAMIVLRYYADCSLDEIAAAMGCRPGTVRATLPSGAQAPPRPDRRHTGRRSAYDTRHRRYRRWRQMTSTWRLNSGPRCGTRPGSCGRPRRSGRESRPT